MLNQKDMFTNAMRHAQDANTPPGGSTSVQGQPPTTRPPRTVQFGHANMVREVNDSHVPTTAAASTDEARTANQRNANTDPTQQGSSSVSRSSTQTAPTLPPQGSSSSDTRPRHWRRPVSPHRSPAPMVTRDPHPSTSSSSWSTWEETPTVPAAPAQWQSFSWGTGPEGPEPEPSSRADRRQTTRAWGYSCPSDEESSEGSQLITGSPCGEDDVIEEQPYCPQFRQERA